MFEGTVVDGETHEGVARAELELSPQGSGATQRATADADGRFRIELPAGEYFVVVLYRTAATPLGVIELESRDRFLWDVEVDAPRYNFNTRGVIGSAHFAPRCPAVTEQAAASQREIDHLIAAVLEHLMQDGVSIPTAEHFFDQKVIYIDPRLDDTTGVTARALPRRFVAKRHYDMQEIADRTGKVIDYLRFTQADIAGDCAIVDAEVALVKPPDSDAVWRCRGNKGLYVKRDGRWRFRLPAGHHCP